MDSSDTAELVKYAANAFLATKIAFINEMARLCECTGADIRQLAPAIGADPRIGPDFLTPGPGFGGSCFPKDLRALAQTGSALGCPVELAEAVIRSNERHKQAMVRKIRTAVGGSFAGKRIAVLGLSFKANTSDVRESPALSILPPLTSEGAILSAYDPAVSSLEGLRVSSAPSAEAALEGADACLILTEWSEFRLIPWWRLAEGMRRRLVIDLRNVCDDREMATAGIDVVRLGDGSRSAIPVAA
jgi:UDPglucose 6-dehydrogenase